VFDLSGKRLGGIKATPQQLKRFRYPADAAAIGDSLLIIDPAAGMGVIVGPTNEWVRDFPFPFTVSKLTPIVWPSIVIGSGDAATPEAAGLTLHRFAFDKDGARLASSFSSSKGDHVAGGLDSTSERVISAQDSSFWSFRFASYELVHWNNDRSFDRILRRRPKWFSRPVENTVGGPAVAPPPRLVGIQPDHSGLMWTFVSVPAETWPKAWPPARSGMYELPASSIAVQWLYRTAVEVLDPGTGTLVAQSLDNPWVIETLPGGKAVTYQPGTDGKAFIAVVTFILKRDR
jgi:hypothetical protein